jgi:hypothetical protein
LTDLEGRDTEIVVYTHSKAEGVVDVYISLAKVPITEKPDTL